MWSDKNREEYLLVEGGGQAGKKILLRNPTGKKVRLEKGQGLAIDLSPRMEDEPSITEVQRVEVKQAFTFDPARDGGLKIGFVHVEPGLAAGVRHRAFVVLVGPGVVK